MGTADCHEPEWTVWDRLFEFLANYRELRALTNDSGRDLAERVGFEPTLRLPVNRISSAAHSTSLPPLREAPGAWPNIAGPVEGARLAEGGRLAKPLIAAFRA
jgi:hypothetical protein